MVEGMPWDHIFSTCGWFWVKQQQIPAFLRVLLLGLILTPEAASCLLLRWGSFWNFCFHEYVKTKQKLQYTPKTKTQKTLIRPYESDISRLPIKIVLNLNPPNKIKTHSTAALGQSFGGVNLQHVHADLAGAESLWRQGRVKFFPWKKAGQQKILMILIVSSSFFFLGTQVPQTVCGGVFS